MSSPRIIYTSRPDATLEAELNVLANVYRFILDCHAKKLAAEPDNCNDAATVRNTEEVSHVEQRLDRPSKTTYPVTLEFTQRTHKTRRHKVLGGRREPHAVGGRHRTVSWVLVDVPDLEILEEAAPSAFS